MVSTGFRVEACVLTTRHFALLASTALISASFATPAMAACDITAAPNSVSCAADTATTDSTNTNAGPASSVDRTQTFDSGGNVTATISAGVTVSGTGLFVQTTEAGAALSFTNSGTVNQTAGAGDLLTNAAVFLQTDTGAITYDSASGATVTGVSSATATVLRLQTASANATGDLTAHINGALTSPGSMGPGAVMSTSGTGKILLDGTGDITGRLAVAVLQGNASAGTDGDITIGGSGNISTSLFGIRVTHGANAGTVTINRTGTITLTGSESGYGIDVADNGTGGTIIAGVGAITSVNGYGIHTSGTANVTITPGAAIAAAIGIDSRPLGAGNTTINSGFDITASNAIMAVTANGSASVNVTGGVLQTTGTAVSAVSTAGNVSVNMTGGQIGTSTAQRVGTSGISAQILNTGSSGNVSVTSGTIFSTGAAVQAQTQGSGTVTVVANGAIDSSNAGISTLSTTGSTTITVNAAVDASTSAIQAATFGSPITILNNGALRSSATAQAVVRAVSFNGNTTITNSATGVITSTAAAPETRTAIQAYAANVTIANAGAMTGVLDLRGPTNPLVNQFVNTPFIHSIANSGTWTTTGASDLGAGTTTITNSGTLTTGDGTSFAGGVVQLNNSATFATTGSFTVNGNTGAGAIANSGAFTIAGTVNINSAGAAGSGVLTNSAGTTNINAGGMLNASLANSGGATTNAGTITGNATISGGTLALTGTGTVLGASGVTNNAIFDITGAAGGSTITTLSGSGVTNLGANTLTLSNAAGAYSGGMNGTGGLTLTAGTEILSGTNTYIGATNVNGGTLRVDGATAGSAFTVNSGGTLRGIGTVGSTTVAAGGVFAPGPATTPGAIAVSGNLVFQAGSIYGVQLTPSAASIANVTGTAALNGNVNVAAAFGAYAVGQSYTILAATGGLSGSTFSGLTMTGGARGHLTYDADEVFLIIDPSTLAASGMPRNPANVADALNGVVNTGGTLPTGFQGLGFLSGGTLTSALTQLAGETGANVAPSGFNAMNQFLNLLFDPSAADGNGGAKGATAFADAPTAFASEKKLSRQQADAYAAVTPRVAPAAFEQRWSTWGAGYGATSTTAGDAGVGSSASNSRVYGIVGGIDYRLSSETRVGFAVGGAGTSFGLASGMGSGRSELFQSALYGRHEIGPAYLAGALAYAWQDVTTTRTVTVAGIDTLEGRFKANALSSRGEAGWLVASPFVNVTPYAALQATTFFLPSYTEAATAGSSQFALGYAAQSVIATRSEFGARFDKAYLFNDGMFTLRSRLAWAHDYNQSRAATATFQALPGTTFTVNGAEPAADALLVTAGAEMKWRNGFSLAGTFEGEFSRNTESYGGKGILRYTW